MQLELLLRSMKKYVKCPHYTVNVIYYADDYYQQGYDELAKEYEGNFIPEKKAVSFGMLTKQVLQNCANKFIILLCDDNVFVRPVDLTNHEFVRFRRDPGIACLSFRLSPTLNWCYAFNSAMVPPVMSNGEYKWREAPGDFRYPTSLDGHVYRADELRELVNSLTFNNPNELEGEMMGVGMQALKIICYPESRVINVPANRVQDVAQNRHMRKYPAEYLMQKFYDGYRISMENLRGIKNNACHMELNYILEEK
jgi:hypothetical protein